MAGPASAALGGATAATFADKPNLQSVTFNNDIASFHFDKPLQTGHNFSRHAFKLGGYRAGLTSGKDGNVANISGSDPTTVLVTYLADDVDVDVATFGTVRDGAVKRLGSTSDENLNDARPVSGAGGENGTVGRTAGPDLQSVEIDDDNNRITYVFDQDVKDFGGALANNFGFVTASGNQAFGAGKVNVDDKRVIIQFAAANDVDSARQAFVKSDVPFVGAGAPKVPVAVGNAAPGPPQVNVNVPGKASLTARPSLVSSVLSQASGTITYTFDQDIDLQAAAPSGANFSAVVSNGLAIVGDTATKLGGDRVKVSFAGGVTNFTEHIVFSSVTAGAVKGANGATLNNAPNGKKVGGNQGAKATGYTTAPDALSATINRAEGEVTVLFDSRLAQVNGANFILRADDGDDLSFLGPGVATFTSSETPAQSRVILQYPPAATQVAAAIDVSGNSNRSADAGINPNGPDGSPNGTNTGVGFNVNPNNAAVIGTVAGGFGFPLITLGDRQNVRTIIVPTATTQTLSK